MIITLCGSTRFKDEYQLVNKHLTLAGHVVISVAFFGHQEEEPPTKAQKAKLDDVHLQKIDLCDQVVVINPGGYVGESTLRELFYAERAGVSRAFLYDVLEGRFGLWSFMREHQIKAMREEIGTLHLRREADADDHRGT